MGLLWTRHASPYSKTDWSWKAPPSFRRLCQWRLSNNAGNALFRPFSGNRHQLCSCSRMGRDPIRLYGTWSRHGAALSFDRSSTAHRMAVPGSWGMDANTLPYSRFWSCRNGPMAFKYPARTTRRHGKSDHRGNHGRNAVHDHLAAPWSLSLHHLPRLYSYSNNRVQPCPIGQHTDSSDTKQWALARLRRSRHRAQRVRRKNRICWCGRGLVSDLQDE